MAQNFNFSGPNANINVPKIQGIFVVKIVIAALVILSLFSAFYTVGANENGVVLRFGKYVGSTEPGLHFKLPFGIDQVTLVKVDYQFKEEFGFRTTQAGVETRYSSANFEDVSWMLTGDLNIAEVRWVVQYRIKDPYIYLFKVRNVESTLRHVAEAAMRLMIGDRSFTECLQTERVAIAEEARVKMQEILDNYETGISIQMVQLQGVTPPGPVADSFNEVNRAKQEQETLVNEARQAFNKEIYRAEGEAQQMINEANGYGVERVNNAKGDVALFAAMLTEYKKAPEITRKRLYLETMNNVLQATDDKTIIDSQLKGILPLLNLNEGGKK